MAARTPDEDSFLNCFEDVVKGCQTFVKRKKAVFPKRKKRKKAVFPDHL